MTDRIDASFSKRLDIEAIRTVRLSTDRCRVTLESSKEAWFIEIMNGIVHVYLRNGLDIFHDEILPLLGGGPRPCPLTLRTCGSNAWEVNGDNLSIQIEKTGHFRVQRAGETVFVLEKWQREGTRLSCECRLNPDDHLYEMGEKTGSLNKRGQRLSQWATDVHPHTPDVDAMYQAIPMTLLSGPSGSRGLFLANTFRTFFDSRATDILTISATDGPLSVYLFTGPTPQAVLEQYTAVTGHSPLPPRWALGYQQSRYSYLSTREVLKIAREFRTRDIPLDVLYLDIDYMDGFCVFTWNPVTFGNAREMTQELDSMGIQIVAIIDPGVKAQTGYHVYDEGLSKDVFMRDANDTLFKSHVWPGLCVFPDFLQKDVRQWWGKKNHQMIMQGISGIWNDMNEPAWWGDNAQAPTGTGHFIDAGVMHRTDMGTRLPHAGVHNVYALLEAMATYQGLGGMDETEASRSRPFILSRSGFSGIQQFSAVWTGDNNSSWEHLAMAIPMCLNMGLSGIPFVGPDLGGFFGNAQPELFIRWIEAGVFFPFLRAHTDKDASPNEPWCFGPEAESIARRFIGYRYRLLPYLESLFAESNQTGAPIMRPLFWVYPDDHMAYAVDDQFLVGNMLLIAPVIRPDARERLVYLPKGVWYDLWTGQRYGGTTHIIAKAPLDRIPVFVRSGAVIPLGPRVSSTKHLEDIGQSGVSSIESLFIVSGTGHFTVYSDDGKTFLYQRGQWRRIHIRVQSIEKTTSVHLTLVNGSLDLPSMLNLFTVRIGYFTNAPRTARVDGRLTAWQWDPGKGIVTIILPRALTLSKPMVVAVER